MPRKYSRLKLMYRSVHSEDFGSDMCNFFGNRGLNMVLNQLGFMGIFFGGILDSCCLDAKKIFKTEINVLFDE